MFFSCDGSENNYDAPCYPIQPFCTIEQWIEIDGPHIKQIDTGMTSEVWAVDENGETFRLGPLGV